jgi:hypothetical protein
MLHDYAGHALGFTALLLVYAIEGRTIWLSAFSFAKGLSHGWN